MYTTNNSRHACECDTQMGARKAPSIDRIYLTQSRDNKAHARRILNNIIEVVNPTRRPSRRRSSSKLLIVIALIARLALLSARVICYLLLSELKGEVIKAREKLLE